MFRSLFIFVLLLCVHHICAQSITFSGAFDPQYNGHQIIIYDPVLDNADTATIEDGRIEFQIPFSGPAKFQLYSTLEREQKGYLAPLDVIISEPATIRIHAAPDHFSAGKTSGSKENELFQHFVKKRNQALKAIVDMQKGKYGSLTNAYGQPDTGDSLYRQRTLEYHRLREESLENELKRLVNLVHTQPGSFTALYLLHEYANRFSLDEIERLFHTLSPRYKNSGTGRSLSEDIEVRKATAIGRVAPDFTQPDTAGHAIQLADFRGRYVLLDFWASWCIPCRKENPNVVKAYQRFKNNGLAILSVSLDASGGKKDWLDAIHKDRMNWTHVSDLQAWNNEVALLYGVKGIPANFLINPEGVIIAKNLRGADLHKKLEEVFEGV